MKLMDKEAFMYGYIAGVWNYAIWKDGEQLVGFMKQNFKELQASIKAGTDKAFNDAWSTYQS